MLTRPPAHTPTCATRNCHQTPPMTPAPALSLDLDDYQAPVLAHERSTETSPHTGRDLEVIRGEVHASSEDAHAAFEAALKAQDGAGIWSHEQPGSPRRRWVVSRGSYTITNGSYRYQVTLREAEDFAIQTLVLDGIELEPYRYEEQAHDGDISLIKALVRVSGETADRLKQLVEEAEYFDAVREGINDQAIEVRFGMCGWSQHDSDVKYSLIIVPKAQDEKDDRGPHISEIARGSRHSTLAYRVELMEELIDLMVEKGMLSEQEVEEARARALAKLPERRQRFLLVDDVDDLAW